ncbi:MAG: PH domain-containing protein [Dehalococcoidia bacterium]
MTYHAAPTPATALGGLLAVWAWAVGSLVLAWAAGWPVAFTTFLAYLSGASLLGLGFVFAYWAYAGLALRYVVEGETLTIKLGPAQQVIPLAQVERVVPGHALPSPRVQGVSWWGLHIGRAHLGSVGDTIVYSTHHSHEQLLYLVTPTGAFALSPQQPSRFTRAVQLRPEADASRQMQPQTRRLALAAQPFWQDRRGQVLALLGLGLNLALFGFIFAVLPGLPDSIPLAFPPGLAERLGSKDEVLELPLVALAVLAVNTALALVLHARERAAAYILLGGAVGLQALLWIATAAAVA